MSSENKNLQPVSGQPLDAAHTPFGGSADVAGIFKNMSKKYMVINQDGFGCGDFDELDEAIGRADELCDNPDSPASRRAKPRRNGNCVYCTEADDQSGRTAQVNQNF